MKLAIYFNQNGHFAILPREPFRRHVVTHVVNCRERKHKTEWAKLRTNGTRRALHRTEPYAKLSCLLSCVCVLEDKSAWRRLAWSRGRRKQKEWQGEREGREKTGNEKLLKLMAIGWLTWRHETNCPFSAENLLAWTIQSFPSSMERGEGSERQKSAQKEFAKIGCETGAISFPFCELFKRVL